MDEKTISDLVSVREAAGLLGLSERQVQQHAANGTIPARKLGLRAWVFSRADVLRLRGRLPRPGWKPGRPRKSA